METSEGCLSLPSSTPCCERLPGESGRAYATFLAYCHLGAERRSLDQVSRRLNGARQLSRKRAATGRIQVWSRRWRWVERAAAYDAYIDELARRENLNAILEHRRRVAAQCVELQERAVKRLCELLPTATVREALAVWTESVRIWRQARGLPPEETGDPPAAAHDGQWLQLILADRQATARLAGMAPALATCENDVQ